MEMACPTGAGALKLRPHANVASEKRWRVSELRQAMDHSTTNNKARVTLDTVKDRLARLLEQADELVHTRYHSESRQEFVDAGGFREWRVSCVVFLQEALGVENAYTREYEFCCDSPYLSAVVRGRAVLRAVREYVAFGRVARVEELVASEIFNDSIAIAKRMVARGNLNAALVAGGTVLEDVLRRNARTRKIAFREDLDDAAAINQKLWQGGAYPTLVSKRVADWIKLARAAEGPSPSGATSDEVLAMLKGVSGFVSDYLV
jgi:hypothetical protein